MTLQINSNYLENYAKDYAATVCDEFFSGRQYITGQDIVQLTNSTQVNFFIIKRLFELWQDELGKLKSNPYFDYRDISVHEALTQFMNVLSRRIKVEREHLQGILETAVKQSIVVATDPVGFYQNEVRKAPQDKINDYLKENRKYYKWHHGVITFLIDKAGFGHDESAYIRAIAANHQTIADSLESVNLLMATLGDVKPFDLDVYLETNEVEEDLPSTSSDDESKSSFFDQVEEDNSRKESTLDSDPKSNPAPTPDPEPIHRSPSGYASQEGGTFDPEMLKAKFETLSYKGMNNVIGELADSLAINQRFMFTKELFDGNADLLKHALKSIDQCGNFEEAIQLVNHRYVNELNWSAQSEPVQEFLELIYRKFDS